MIGLRADRANCQGKNLFSFIQFESFNVETSTDSPLDHHICIRFPYLRMAAFCDLPIEMRLEILEKLNLHELVVNSSKTCHQWRDDIAQHILAPKILALAEVNEKFKMDIKEKGWAEEANNPTELIMSLYNKYEHFTSKFFFC